ncbi:FAD-dependent monooxygenase [Rathayibacter sp. YIM 133350]|uniref:FAD-dependent monooxygenase n=1 Tax=Rathayibacter sp. YIM 133350 TaxID=3131992 RepID=UPI00307DE00D
MTSLSAEGISARRVPVAIVGGGPVGLTMALELARHGRGCVLVEPRLDVDHSRPRAKTTSARTMELFRRTGAADEIRRRAAIPASWSDEVRFCTTAAGHEITRLRGVLGLELLDSELTAEGAQQVTQSAVEEALRAMLDAEPLVTTLFGSRVTSVDLTRDGARLQVEDLDDRQSVVEADYVIGADGSRSIVRAELGARYEGAAAGRPNVNITFRSRELASMLPERPAIHHWVLNPTFPGVIGPLSLDGEWWAIATATEAIADDDEAAAVVRGLVGAPIDVEVIATDPWQARMLLADSYGFGRAFLVGDAAHQNPPWGGHGYNTGIGDAVNLAWKIAAVSEGWATPALLESYEAERRPIAQQTIALAAGNLRALSHDLTSPAMMAAGVDGESARASAALAIEQVKRAEFYSLGLVLGYGYGPHAAAQTPSPDLYLPVAAPGNRLPHSRNAAGDSLFDLLGFEFTALGAEADVEPWMAVAGRRGIPLVHVDPGAHGFDSTTPGEVSLVRPDQHIAWMGKASADPDEAFDAALLGFTSAP